MGVVSYSFATLIKDDARCELTRACGSTESLALKAHLLHQNASIIAASQRRSTVHDGSCVFVKAWEWAKPAQSLGSQRVHASTIDIHKILTSKT